MNKNTAVKQNDEDDNTDSYLSIYDFRNQGVNRENESEEVLERRMQDDESMQVFGYGLQVKFDAQVALKVEVERRWLEGLRHYHGKHDTETSSKFKSGKKGSRLFVNLTRSTSNTAESKLSDLILPTDDRNWGLKSTPVPNLVKALKDDTELMLEDGSIAVNPDEIDQETQEPIQYKNSDIAKETIEQAKKAAELMQNQIDDQLTESGFNAICRRIIHDAVVIGTGIIKGPMVERSAKKAWVKGDSGEWELSVKIENKPISTYVDPWNFFPDMSAVRWQDSEFEFERHLMTRKDLRKLAKNPGFLKSQISTLLQQQPNGTSANVSYLNELREINGITQASQDNRYEVLEYHGPIEKEQLILCGCDIDDDDDLEEFEGVVWFSLGIVIKVGLNHMDSNESPYNILNWEKDDTSIFGFGVPYRSTSAQIAVNSSWRMIMDNAGLSTGPQVILNREMIQPVNGKWELTPRKLWYLTGNDPRARVEDAMKTFNIESHQNELMEIFETSRRLINDETSVPNEQLGPASRDAQQPAMLKTLGGTQLWMSSNNIMMRRAVKNFDDDIIRPHISRFYDWNMQFSENPDIKGDFNVDARGTSVLLVREMQARNISEFIAAAMGIPGGAEELAVRGLLKNMAKGMQVAIDDVLKSDDESEAQKKKAQKNPPQDPEVQKIAAQKELKQMEIDAKMQMIQMESQERLTIAENERQIAIINREVELSKLSATSEVSLEKIRSDANIKKYDTNWNIKKFYEEMALKERDGDDSNVGLV